MLLKGSRILPETINFEQANRNVLWHESILDYHRGLFDSRQLSTPVEQLYVAKLDIDGTQDTNCKSLKRRVLQTSSKMYSAIMNVVIRLFHGMAGSSNLSSRFFTSALVLKVRLLRGQYFL